MDKLKYQYEGMKWLVELELLNHPQVINTIRFNILMASKRIKEVELLIYRENKAMLVLLDLSWLGRTFYKKRIFEDVQEVLTQLLPSFRFRITDNPEIMELAVEKVKKALTGGKNENASNPSNPIVEQPSQSANAEASATAETVSGSPEGADSNPQEQSQPGQPVFNSAGPDDSKKEQGS
jgi:hypothetical protein